MTENSPSAQGFGRREEVPRPIVPKSAREALQPEPGTPPPKRSRRSRNQIVVFLNFVVSAAFFVTLAAGAAIYLGKVQFTRPGPSTTTTLFMVKPNSGLIDIAEQLERQGLIRDSRLFRFGVQAYQSDKALKAGEYEIKAGASMHDIMELLRSGKSVLHSLLIPEGMTVAQAWRRIAEHEALAGEMPDEMPPEGSLVADTQRFTRGASRKEIIERMIAEQKRLVESIWARRADDLPLANINEFVTLASIVEKETGRGDERSRVAAVFLNRLRKGMRLQSDPTIIYGIFGGAGKPPDRPIYRSDIDTPTPYNTYTNAGLPPTPIANPGRAALEAVANPSRTDDLYFVADGSGGHVFAETLEEHNQNVARWRAVEKQRQEEAAAEEEANSEGDADPAAE